MCLKKGYRQFTFLITLFLICETKLAIAQSQGWGTVNMHGSILETACSIDINSRDQTINMATLPISQIIRDGYSSNRFFTIQLVNCDIYRWDSSLPNFSHFKITFDGLRENKLFGIEGEATGVGLQITDSLGEIAIPGKTMSAINITPKDMLLKYSIRLVGNYQPLTTGNYYSNIKFKMDYY